MTNFRKDNLENAITERNIMLPEDVKWTNDKIVKALGDYTISRSPASKFSWGARYLQSLETVQLCRHLKDEMKTFKKYGVDPMEDPNYVAEFKENGARVFIYYDPAVGFQFFSRRESVTNFVNRNFTNVVLLIKDGIIKEPQDYVGKFNMRFILDGEVTVAGDTLSFENVEYNDTEDLLQSIIGSLPDRAKSFQKAGGRFIFNIFDCIFFEDKPKGIPPEVKFDYYAADKELTKEEIMWVESQFADYLKNACFKGYSSAKKLYNYLYTLRNTVPGDIRRLPFGKRRQLRKKLVQYLQQQNLPFVEVGGEDVHKVEYLDEVLGNACEGIILKELHAPYISALKSSRSHRACMKVKQSINALLTNKEMNEDFDVFITGINKPKSDRVKDMIGSLNCSVYIQEKDGTTTEHVIASVSGIPHDWKRELCAFDEYGEMVLNPAYYGKVIAINGMALTYKLKFQHAVLNNKVDLVFKDKNPDSCTWDREVLEGMIITRGNASVN